MFNVLGDAVEGSRFIDVFAGTGAVGIEALSRGAAEVVFLENHTPAAALIRQNLESLGISLGATVLAMAALRGLEKLAEMRSSGQPGYDFVFVDPPYAAADDYLQVLRRLGTGSLLESGAKVIVEHRRNFELVETIGCLRRTRILRQGDASLSFFAVQSGSAEGAMRFQTPGVLAIVAAWLKTVLRYWRGATWTSQG